MASNSPLKFMTLGAPLGRGGRRFGGIGTDVPRAFAGPCAGAGQAEVLTRTSRCMLIAAITSKAKCFAIWRRRHMAKHFFFAIMAAINIHMDAWVKTSA